MLDWIKTTDVIMSLAVGEYNSGSICCKKKEKSLPGLFVILHYHCDYYNPLVRK